MLIVRQSTARTVTVGPVLDVDGLAVTNGVVGDFKIAKNGAAPAALNGSATLTHRNTGHYSLALTATDTNTVGQAEIVIDDGTNVCPIKELTVIEETVYDALFAASANGYAPGYGPAVLRTTVSSITSQTDIVPTAASAENNSYVGRDIIIRDDAETKNIIQGVVTASTDVSIQFDVIGTAGFTIGAGDIVEIFGPAFSEEDRDAMSDITSAGPVEHTHVPKSRVLPVKSRGDGTIGVIGTVYIQPGETLWYAVDLAGSQLAPGDLINSMSAPSIAGDQSANLTTPSYGVLGTLAKFKCVASGSADALDEIYINLTLSPETGESLKVQVPVTIKEASS